MTGLWGVVTQRTPNGLQRGEWEAVLTALVALNIINGMYVSNYVLLSLIIIIDTYISTDALVLYIYNTCRVTSLHAVIEHRVL